jgi:Fe-S cluster biogenesis protein NfuA
MFIQSEATPNPTTRRLLPGRTLHGQAPVDAPTLEVAQAVSPLATALFQHPKVRGVMVGPDWLSVTLSQPNDWETDGANVLLIVGDHLTSDKPILHATEEETTTNSDSPWPTATADERALLARVDELLATRVRPALAQDGGDAVLVGLVEGGGVRIALKGACVGCPSSTLTLKMGIENLLRHYFPGEVGWVEAA